MEQYSLNGTWTLTGEEIEPTEGEIPGSLYSFLLNAGKMDNPFYRENELNALQLSYSDCIFSYRFDVPATIATKSHQAIRFDGIDTIADVYLNGVFLGHTENFHRTWEFDIASAVRECENLLEVKIQSPTHYIAGKDREKHIGGSTDAMSGFPYLRKPHCMFGWDWGPRLPDMGIWRDVTLLGWDDVRLGDVSIRQLHGEKGKGPVQIQIRVDLVGTSDSSIVHIALAGPDACVLDTVRVKADHDVTEAVFTVSDPQLWWPNGLGEQPLYTVTAAICSSKGPATPYETVSRRIGLRTMSISDKEDEWGTRFAHEVNGHTFFAMGADYIPEDNLFSRITPDRTRKLLGDCKAANFNVIRVWGGGYYPSDDFYDACDELGLVVWQDLMFACAYYPIDDAFVDNYSEEIRQNVRRIRHHASLGLWCGNNEMEQFAEIGEFEGTPETRADYLLQNEYIIPQILKVEDPDTFYWPSSPSSGGKFLETQSPDKGDTHFWTVWHGGAPYTEYRKHHFRYLSEFGFQSFPCLETVKSFTLPEDRNIFSRVMERHQRNAGANGKILQYLSQIYMYPGSFALLLYASQLLQKDAIRYGVEHLRRNRNGDRCMGAVYWQLNDIWPGASWSSIDYYGRWKALHYAARRFFAPILISCEEKSELSTRASLVAEPTQNISTACLWVTNDTWNSVEGVVEWELRDADSHILLSGEKEITVGPFSAYALDQLDFSDTDYLENHLCYRFRMQGDVVSEGTVLFTAPKHYHFKDPHLVVKQEGDEIVICSNAFARDIEVYPENGSIRFSDNFFDMEAGERRIRIAEGTLKGPLFVRSTYDIR